MIQVVLKNGKYAIYSNGIGGQIPPVNTIAPVISGTTTLGSTLSCTTGTWTGKPITFYYAYQWRRNGVAILGANSNTYVTTFADSLAIISCEVTANNCGYVIPSNTVAPAISGPIVLGQTLTSTTGTWSSTIPVTYSYQWLRGSTYIGTNSNSYTLISADLGQNITCVVTAANEAGVASTTSNSLSILSTLLDVYPSAAAAYSVRLLKGSFYTSNAIKVRRSSDNSEQDIGFTTSGNLDQTALTTFCGAGDGYIVTWYDQSGNARNATQASPGNQPQIVSSGSVITQNSKPTLQFVSGSVSKLEGVWSQIITTESNFGVFAMNNASYNFGRVLSQSGNGNDYDAGGYIPMIRNGTSSAMCSFTSAGAIASSAITYSTQTLFSSIHTGTQVANKVNNDSEVVAGDTLNLTVTRTSIGGETSTSVGTGYLDGTVQEVIIYYTNETANRTGISTNINTHYGIY